MGKARKPQQSNSLDIGKLIQDGVKPLEEQLAETREMLETLAKVTQTNITVEYTNMQEDMEVLHKSVCLAKDAIQQQSDELSATQRELFFVWILNLVLMVAVIFSYLQ